MNNEQNPNIENTPIETNMPANNPAPTPQNNADEGMTTAVVNPNFMEEVENPAPQAPTPAQAAPVMEVPIAPAPAPAPVEPPKKKGMNKGVLIAIIVILVVVLGIGGYAAYLFFGVSPRNAHDKIIDDFFADAHEFAEKLTVSTNADAKTMKLSADLSFDTNMDELSMLKDYSFKLDAEEDKEDNYFNVKLSALEKNKSLLEGSVYLLNNKMYLDSKDLYDRVIEVGDAEINIDTEELTGLLDLLNSENTTHLLDTLQKALKDSFNKDKFTRKLETAKINGKSVKAFNNSYVIDEATAYSMLKTMLTTFRNDEKSLQIITDFANEVLSSSVATTINSNSTTEGVVPNEVTVNDVKELLDSLIDEVKDPELTGSTAKVYFNVYTSMLTNQVIGVKLIVKDDGQTINLLDYYEDGDNSGIKISLDDKESFVFEVNTKDTKSDFKITVDGETILTGTLVSTETKAELTVTIEGEVSDDISGVTLAISSETVDDTVKMQVKVRVEQDGKTSEIAVKLNVKVTYDEKLTKPDVSKAISIEEVDAEKLSDNLMGALENSDLYDVLAPYLEQPDYDTDYDYDSDMDYNDDEETPSVVDPVYSEHCDEAINCDCLGDACYCEYKVNGWKTQSIVCPNPNI